LRHLGLSAYQVTLARQPARVKGNFAMMIDGLIELLQLAFYTGQYSKASFSAQRKLMNDFSKKHYN
jgi:hypothetical protein